MKSDHNMITGLDYIQGDDRPTLDDDHIIDICGDCGEQECDCPCQDMSLVKPLRRLFRGVGIALMLLTLYAATRFDWISVGVFGLSSYGCLLVAHTVEAWTKEGHQERAFLSGLFFVGLGLLIALIN